MEEFDGGPAVPAGTLEAMRKHLLRRFLRLLLPPAVVLSAVESAKALGQFTSLKYVDHPTWDVVIFALAAVFAFVLPILYRTLFTRAQRGKTAVSISALFRFESNRMGIAHYALWFAVIASLIAVPGWYMSAILVLALYAALTTFPFRPRLTADARVFHVGAPSGNPAD